METIDRLLPERDLDINTLDDDEQVIMMTTQKQRRNLEDVFVDKHGGVSSVKIRTLLDVSAPVPGSAGTAGRRHTHSSIVDRSLRAHSASRAPSVKNENTSYVFRFIF